MGALKWGLKATLCNLRTIVYNCALLLGQKSCRTKVSRIFRIFVPNFAPNFAPNFPRIFRGLFVLRKPKGDGGKGTGKKKSRQFATNVTTIYDMVTATCDIL